MTVRTKRVDENKRMIPGGKGPSSERGLGRTERERGKRPSRVSKSRRVHIQLTKCFNEMYHRIRSGRHCRWSIDQGEGEGDIYKGKRRKKIKHSETENEIGSIKLTMSIENNII